MNPSCNSPRSQSVWPAVVYMDAPDLDCSFADNTCCDNFRRVGLENDNILAVHSDGQLSLH